MDKRIVAALMLCGVSPFCYAKQDCETLAGIAAGEANYLYATANVSADSRLHFYSAPASRCQLPAFLVNSDTVEVLRSSQRYESTGMLSKDEPFRYVRYRGANGTFATGWVTADGLTPLANPLPVSPACQTWANKAMSQREKMPPPPATIIRSSAARALDSIQCQMHSVATVPYSGSRRRGFCSGRVQRRFY